MSIRRTGSPGRRPGDANEGTSLELSSPGRGKVGVRPRVLRTLTGAWEDNLANRTPPSDNRRSL